MSLNTQFSCAKTYIFFIDIYVWGEILRTEYVYSYKTLKATQHISDFHGHRNQGKEKEHSAAVKGLS